MMRDANLNRTRLHTHPHPTLVLDLAGEGGILVTGEAGLHGAGGSQGADDPRYWQAAEDHVRRFVARDRNRPCLVLWSVENEMRWNGDRTDLTKRELPRLRQQFNELDPARPAYHDGDSSLWNETDQALISRHYGKESSGLGWWNRKQPLHSGETALYHYSGPNNTCHLGGDRVWADFDQVDEAASLDTALIVERAARWACRASGQEPLHAAEPAAASGGQVDLRRLECPRSQAAARAIVSAAGSGANCFWSTIPAPRWPGGLTC